MNEYLIYSVDSEDDPVADDGFCEKKFLEAIQELSANGFVKLCVEIHPEDMSLSRKVVTRCNQIIDNLFGARNILFSQEMIDAQNIRYDVTYIGKVFSIDEIQSLHPDDQQVRLQILQKALQTVDTENTEIKVFCLSAGPVVPKTLQVLLGEIQEVHYTFRDKKMHFTLQCFMLGNNSPLEIVVVHFFKLNFKQ